MIDIPFYKDIYEFPGPSSLIYPLPCHIPHFKQTQVIETSKEVIINDMKGNTRYSIQLVSQMLDDGHLGFQVRVVHYWPNGQQDEDSNPMLQIPEDHFDPDYKKMEKVFSICVQRYDSLVRAETKDFNDIDIYADKIGYEKTKPECCAFCRWCRKSRWHCGHGEPMLECHNPKNQLDFNYMVDIPDFPSGHCHRYRDNWQKLPWMQEDPFKRMPLRGDEVLDRIFPKVDPFGKCKNFEKDDRDHCTRHDNN